MNQFIDVTNKANTYTTEDGLLSILFEDTLQLLFHLNGDKTKSVLLTECERNGSTDEEYVEHELMYIHNGYRFLFGIGCKKTISGRLCDKGDGTITASIIVSSTNAQDGIENITLTCVNNGESYTCMKDTFNYVKNTRAISRIS